MTDIITLKPRTITHTVQFAVRMLHGDLVNRVVIESDIAPAQYAKGDHVWIAGLDGFPESRLTMGVVRKVTHVIGGNTVNMTHDVTIDVDETENELAA